MLFLAVSIGKLDKRSTPCVIQAECIGEPPGCVLLSGARHSKVKLVQKPHIHSAQLGRLQNQVGKIAPVTTALRIELGNMQLPVRWWPGIVAQTVVDVN